MNERDNTPSSPKRRKLLASAALASAAAVAPTHTSAQAQTPARNAMRANGPAAFTKSLPHETNGAVDAAAMKQFEAATESARIADWEALPVKNEIRLVNPLA
ncbi:MAG: hypothetical protein ACRCWJ_18830, partial [Casimicrobium sp.]